MLSESINDAFSAAAQISAREMGRARSFIGAIGLVLGWAICGPIFGFSDTWQLLINTGTTIATWLMMFLLQNTQNRDYTELNLKIDELIRATDGARNHMIALEKLSERQLHDLERWFTQEATDEIPEQG